MVSIVTPFVKLRCAATATIRLAKMNLAVHGLEGDIQEANTFYEDKHRLQDGRPLWGNVDFMMAKTSAKA